MHVNIINPDITDKHLYLSRICIYQLTNYIIVIYINE